MATIERKKKKYLVHWLYKHGAKRERDRANNVGIDDEKIKEPAKFNWPEPMAQVAPTGHAHTPYTLYQCTVQTNRHRSLIRESRVHVLSDWFFFFSLSLFPSYILHTHPSIKKSWAIITSHSLSLSKKWKSSSESWHSRLSSVDGRRRKRPEKGCKKKKQFLLLGSCEWRHHQWLLKAGTKREHKAVVVASFSYGNNTSAQ